MLLSFKKFIQEAKEKGQKPGKFELVKTTLEDAVAYAQKLFKGKLYDHLPDFDKNYKYTQKLASLGTEKRKDMPVIKDQDVKKLQTRLSKGMIDINKPFAPETDSRDPFPEGLSGPTAKKWLQNGLKRHDKEHGDDIVKVKSVKTRVGDLKPIQQQVYYDKSIDPIAQNGVENSRKFFENKTFFITSSDNRIIDGHHRFLAANLIDPDMKVSCLQIDLPISKLLPVTKAFGDAIGNERNQ